MDGAGLLAYYILAFLQEEDLLNALRAGGLSLIWRGSKLLRAEFCLAYYPVIVYFWAVWLPAAGGELRRACLARPRCHAHLRPRSWTVSWETPGEPAFIDGADIQWRDFRAALPLLLPAAALLAGATRAAAVVLGGVAKGGKGQDGAARPRLGVSVRLAVGLGFLLYVHGAGAAFPLALVLLFYGLARATAGSRLAVPAAWLAALAAIAAKEPKWPIRRHLRFETVAGARWAFLDDRRYQGEYDWAESVNLIVLRLLSFALDCHRSTSRRKAAKADRVLDTRLAASSDQSAWERGRYTLIECASHAFYAPLFLAGPTICFDDYAEQCVSARAPRTHLGWYLVQLASALLALEMAACRYPCFALARSGELGRLGPRLGAAAVFLTLNMMWLKFLVIWRIARAWALADGVDPPENMRRALCNHYSVASFWQCWHASYNRWLVRYIYVPVGGRNRRVLATTATFLFVALWHDAEAKLLAWGGLNALFIAVELAAAEWLRRRAEALGLPTRRPWLHRQLCALCGATCIFLLMAVNMIGYSVGIGGVAGLLATAAGTRAEGLRILGGAYAVLFCGVQVMLEVRRLDGSAAPSSSAAVPAVTPAACSTAAAAPAAGCGAGGSAPVAAAPVVASAAARGDGKED